MSEQIFELKGNLFTLSVLHLFKNDLDSLISQLDEKIAQVPKFFFGAPIVVNLQSVPNEHIDFAKLKQALIDLQLNPVGVCNGTDEQNTAAKLHKLSILNYSKDQTPKAKPQSAANTSIVEKEVCVPAQIISGNVRGGQQVYAKNRDLIITGSVSPGAEVIADGNIHVYGTLRGRALAGVKGNTNARIFCHSLEAELVSVAGQYKISEDIDKCQIKKPMQIYLDNDNLCFKEIEP